MTGKLPFAELERAYELIAEALDQVGPERERLFLAKLALALCHECDDLEQVKTALDAARQQVD